MGFSLDVKAAHKRIVLHPDECGLVGFSLEGTAFLLSSYPVWCSFLRFLVGAIGWTHSTYISPL